eukprot:m.450308 g.450308  ORF g.450308 m.450308 type:complete len:127 (-) comp19969_c0_seq1:125-505(-)
MSALGLMGMLPSLVPANTDDVWQGRAKAVDPVAALRQQELDFQHLLQAVKYSAMTNQVIGKDQSDSGESDSDGSILSGEDDESHSLEYPSDEDESPLDIVMHGEPEEEESTEMDGDDGEIGNWTFY